MKVKILECMAGDDYVHDSGDVVEIADAEAGRLIAAGIAEAAEKTVTKTASKSPVKETAAKETKAKAVKSQKTKEKATSEADSK